MPSSRVATPITSRYSPYALAALTSSPEKKVSGRTLDRATRTESESGLLFTAAAVAAQHLPTVVV